MVSDKHISESRIGIKYFNGEWGFLEDGTHFFVEELPVWVAVNDEDLADYSGEEL